MKPSRLNGLTSRASVIALSIVLGVVVFWAFTPKPSSSSWAPENFSTRDAIDDAASGPFDFESVVCVESMQLEPGEALAVALERMGVDGADLYEAVQAFGGEMELRLIRPSDRFTLHRGVAGNLERLEYQRNPESRIVVSRDAALYACAVEKFPVERAVRYFHGRVEGNLFDSVIRAGGGAKIVCDLSELLAWSFDFFTETQAGDEFSILVEERRIEGKRIGFGRILAGQYLPRGSHKPLEAFLHEGSQHEGYYDREGHSIKRAFLKSPLNFSRISSHFSHSRMHPILKKRRPHLGIDYAAPHGTPVVALGKGEISLAGWIRGFGNTVKIKHHGTYLTQYAHLSRFARGIRPGSKVQQGQVIGYVGSTGLSTGPHLDFRIRENGKWINPLKLKGGKSAPLPGVARGAFIDRAQYYLAVMADSQPGQEVGPLGREALLTE
ncbi:MAG: M23 family metallopeptidase [Candidatus Eisenbacteria bacterium]|uniref:M23 family metallopeptidase n=1 Tax=Eiseniibacteriota bacterium TaxID=2212470 RepID=A0A7Y2E6Z5_UNCEI|nr:M23 family metallopeptidase [Candidatus Eisenbacteria bacterium]